MRYAMHYAMHMPPIGLPARAYEEEPLPAPTIQLLCRIAVSFDRSQSSSFVHYKLVLYLYLCRITSA